MLLSVVIVSYNTQELLKSCLESVINALKNINGEIFVVDNNSHDNTVKTVKEKFPTVTLIENKKNLGFSKANNQALKKAKGKYFLILNPDSQVQRETFQKMVDFMERNKKTAVATCRVELPDGNLDRDCRRHFPTPPRALSHFLSLDRLFKGSKTFDSYYMGYIPENVEHEVDACVGAFMIVRSSAVKKVGLFDENFFFYGEDLDWCFRFKEAGYKIFYTPITKIIHYKGASSGIKKSSSHLTKATRLSKEKVIRESTRAMRLFYRKHFSDKYSVIVTLLVLTAVTFVEYWRLLKIRYL